MKARIPRLVMVTAAERAPRLLTPNVYYGSQVIGVAVRLWPRRKPAHGQRMISILWARPTAPAVWCYCYATPEPKIWVFPDDEHSDTHGFDLRPSSPESGEVS